MNKLNYDCSRMIANLKDAEVFIADLDEFHNFMLRDDDLYKFLILPFAAEDRRAVIVDILVCLNIKNELLQHFLNYVIIHNIKELADILNTSKKILMQKKNVKVIEIISSCELSASRKSDTKNIFTGSEVVFRVDPSLIAGIVVKIGSQTHDYSVSNSLRSLASCNVI